MSKCLSFKSRSCKSIQCNFKKKIGYDFCGHHLKKKIYFNKKLEKDTIDLDNDYSHYLLFIEDSWRDIPIDRRTGKIGGGYWDIVTLTEHLSSQLNLSYSGNPKPVIPEDPFTKVSYTVEEFIKIRQHIQKLKIKIDIVLKIFLDHIMESNKIKNINIINIFENELRYMMINKTDSQDCFTGYWVKKETPKTDFEKLYEEWNNISPYSNVYDGLETTIIDNPQKKYFLDILKTCEITDNKSYVLL